MILKESIARKVRALIAAAFLCMITLPAPVYSAAEDLYGAQDMEMLVGDIQPVTVKNLSRISITDPSIADISDAKTDEVLLMAKRAGQTVLFLWDDIGKRSVVIRVLDEDMGLVKARISKLIKKADIKGVSLEENNYEGRVVVTGEFEEEELGKLEKILSSFDEKIINLTKEKIIKDQIQIDMQITELNTSITKSLGIQWGAGEDTDSFTLLYPETMPSLDGSVGDYFKVGDFQRSNALLATISAFIKEGKGRILSKPRIVVVSGKEASFLVGGEIPFKTTTLNTTGGSVTEETTFKQYGVNLTLTPTIVNGKIEIDLNVEVSDVDAANASGSDVAFVTRNATTHLNLDNGQTIVLAGLIKKSESEEIKRIPFISKVPIIGLLFRHKGMPTPTQDTELVITLTPRILNDMAAVAKKKAERVPPAANTASSNMYADDAPQSIPLDYAQSLQRRISSAVNYPYEAKENGWEGTVKISLRILKDGTLADASVQQSSGYSIFDQDALNTAKILAPYQSFSSDMSMDELVVVVPIVYSQRHSSKAP
jgi:pilus assembly protein CpaC